jgi:NnrS protein
MAPKHPLLVRPFALVALAVALAGSTLGAILLLRIQLALGPVAPLWKQVHGQAQVFGFIVPLILGFGTYLVPRIVAGHPIRNELALPALAAFTLAAVTTFAVPFASGATALLLRRALALLVATGSLAGAACLAAPLVARRRERERRRGHETLLESSLAFLALAGLADAASWWLSEEELPQGLATAAWRLAVEGFAIGMTLAVSARMFSGFLGVAPALADPPGGRRHAAGVRDRVFSVAAVTWAASVVLGSAGALICEYRLERLADVLFALGVTPLALQLGLAPTSGGPAIDRTRDPLFPFGARAAYALLVAGALIGAGAGAADLFGAPVHSLWFDARRHLLTIGFLLTLIATMAGRLAPGFAGRPLALPWLRAFAMGAFALSATLRALEGVAGQWGPAGLLWLSALSGPLAASGLFALTACLVATLLSTR